MAARRANLWHAGVVQTLVAGPHTAGQIAATLGVTRRRAEQMLRAMADAQLVEPRGTAPTAGRAATLWVLVGSADSSPVTPGAGP